MPNKKQGQEPLATLQSSAASKTSAPEQLPAVQRFLEELEWDSTQNYVERLREGGDLLQLGAVDVDVPRIVLRHFICDARRCIEWAGERPLLDMGCCCRYEVPLTAHDRGIVREHLAEVRPLLPDGHRLHDPKADPFACDENDYGFKMVHDNPLGGCQFNLYREGRCRCALHSAALAAGGDPLEWKPLACSLWPLALNSHTVDGQERYLLTIYCEETSALFDDAEDDPFACLVDQDASYPRVYESERAVLEHLFGRKWWHDLDRAARRLIAQRES
jgi:hypothetical protein